MNTVFLLLRVDDEEGIQSVNITAFNSLIDAQEQMFKEFNKELREGGDCTMSYAYPRCATVANQCCHNADWVIKTLDEEDIR